ncbi:MAG: hypothetical protein QCI38_00910 [Candidatus Thermoplasmatota archaeon]|nr:hypothetical protein [Candidatus Thermoplasmatota archaeon]
MGAYNSLFRHVLFPAFDIARGTTVMKELRSLERTQTLPRQELERLQRQRLSAMLHHAYENVPYYNRLFKEMGLKPTDIKTVEDLQKLPPLTKDIIRNNPDDLLAKPQKDKPIVCQTGGSTGEPLRFFVTKSMLSHASAALYRAWSWNGFNLGNKSILIWGANQDIVKHKNLFSQSKRRLQRISLYDAFSLDEEKMESIISQIGKEREYFMRSYASSAELLARYVINNGINVELSGVLTTAETLMPEQRTILAKAFNCDVFDGYGSRETSLIAHECNKHHGYHISEENSIVEIIKDGQQVLGEDGALLITDLHNRAMPFIRYQIEDVANKNAELDADCGICLARLDRIRGRTSDIITTFDGKYVHGEVFTHIFYNYSNVVERFQIVQKDIGFFVVSIVPKSGSMLDEDRTKDILHSLRNVIGCDAEIDVAIVDRISTTASGKHRFTISNVPVKFT